MEIFERKDSNLTEQIEMIQNCVHFHYQNKPNFQLSDFFTQMTETKKLRLLSTFLKLTRFCIVSLIIFSYQTKINEY